ncbi:hypothetical protein BDA99DRAFT_59970 [Phascolomyces articulosus]|uniref:Uncharacterized protein n=1 Tax=Phascolomyces articulosus TaxID=60185 RepID=A0AAD5PDW6_9FUNG|nr:hypothetical protein BDA99DRAFT_59970 [Phascolomyces articulosus]
MAIVLFYLIMYNISIEYVLDCRHMIACVMGIAKKKVFGVMQATSTMSMIIICYLPSLHILLSLTTMTIEYGDS